MIADYLSGIAGGIAVVMVGHPFDTIKTRLQTAPSGFYNGTLDCINKTLKWEGAKGFYSGIHSPLAGQMFFRAASFGFFYNTGRMLMYMSGRNELLSSQLLICGGITGFMIAFIETPIDLIKTKLQIQIFQSRIDPKFVPKYTTTYACVRYIIQHHGIKALWQGLSATIIRNVPANAVFFPVNELVKRTFAAHQNLEVRDLPLVNKLFAGSCAGLCYWVGTYPLDIVKAKIQSLHYENRISWLAAFRDIVSRGEGRGRGYRELTRGLVPCAMRAIPACAVMFATVDIVRFELYKYI